MLIDAEGLVPIKGWRVEFMLGNLWALTIYLYLLMYAASDKDCAGIVKVGNGLLVGLGMFGTIVLRLLFCQLTTCRLRMILELSQSLFGYLHGLNYFDGYHDRYVVLKGINPTENVDRFYGIMMM